MASAITSRRCSTSVPRPRGGRARWRARRDRRSPARARRRGRLEQPGERVEQPAREPLGHEAVVLEVVEVGAGLGLAACFEAEGAPRARRRGRPATAPLRSRRRGRRVDHASPPIDGVIGGRGRRSARPRSRGVVGGLGGEGEEGSIACWTERRALVRRGAVDVLRGVGPVAGLPGVDERIEEERGISREVLSQLGEAARAELMHVVGGRPELGGRSRWSSSRRGSARRRGAGWGWGGG